MDEHNIDKLFKKKLKDFKEVPDEHVWNAISASLDKKGKKRRIIPIWWRWAGVAAVLLLGLLIFNPFKSSDPAGTEISGEEIVTPGETGGDLPENTPTIVPDNAVTEEAGNRGITEGTSEGTNPESGVVSNTKTVLDPGKDIQQRNRPAREEAVKREEAIKDAIAVTPDDRAQTMPEEGDAVAANTGVNRTVNDAVETPDVGVPEEGVEEEVIAQEETAIQDEIEDGKKSIFDEIEEEEEAVAQTTDKKWSVGPSVAPVYFDALGSGSPVDARFAGNSKSGDVSMSYGLSLAYNLSKRWEIRSGVHRVDYGYSTDNVEFSSSFNGLGADGLENINYVPSSTNLVVRSQESKAAPDEFALANDVAAQNPSRDGSMVQEIGYMEVPLEVSYRVLDKKLGVKVLAGVSSLFLLDNNVSLESQGNTMLVGEANNINSLNFSTNLGIGVSYEAAKNLELQVEPMLKYQLNTFSNVSGNFQPYTVGVYSGVRYKF